jgi:hypothetical protein
VAAHEAAGRGADLLAGTTALGTGFLDQQLDALGFKGVL